MLRKDMKVENIEKQQICRYLYDFVYVSLSVCRESGDVVISSWEVDNGGGVPIILPEIPTSLR